MPIVSKHVYCAEIGYKAAFPKTCLGFPEFELGKQEINWLIKIFTQGRVERELPVNKKERG